ncbi:hypothetical protein GBAR_LOCUS23174, partial [Geodia barretti]
MMLGIFSTPDEDTIWPSLSNHCESGSRLEFVLSQVRNSLPPSLTVVAPVIIGG